ncbi:MAG: peptidoglycan editing factor PgeF, partial [Betaproteobacteria bacterium]
NLDEHASPVQSPATADAAVTTRVGLACTVLVADCLPVLLTDVAGRAVAAAHAGWRGLAAGILENTLQALCERAGCSPAQVQAWLGPCIGPQAFEVGPDVLQAFGHSPCAANTSVDGDAAAVFRYAPRPDGTPRWRADLAALARLRLHAAGLHRISSSGLCTVSDTSRFFSFRRDGLTGRMAASIWRHG